MDIPPYAESVWGDNVTQEADGTFSTTLPYGLDDQKITGLPSKRIALEVAYALSEAYNAGASSDCDER